MFIPILNVVIFKKIGLKLPFQLILTFLPFLKVGGLLNKECD